MAFHDDLLEQANHLATLDPRRPKQASLRRAVSTAYYALFHLLIHDAVSNWKRPQHRDALARLFDHGKMKHACEQRGAELRKAIPRLTGEEQRVARRLEAVTRIFVEMQQQRHTADYDGGGRWARTETVSRIKSVHAAFFSWKDIRDHPMAQDFLLSLFVKKR